MGAQTDVRASRRLSPRGCTREAAALVGIDDEGDHPPAFCVPKSALVGDAAVAEEAGDHGERGDRQGLVDERFLRVDRRSGAAARQRVFLLAHHLWEQLGDNPQSFLGPFVSGIQGLTEDELASCAVVAQVEVIADAGKAPGDSCCDLPARRSRIHASHHDVIVVGVSVSPEALAREVARDGRPIQPPEEVQAIHEDGGLVLAYVRDRERLANAVRF